MKRRLGILVLAGAGFWAGLPARADGPPTDAAPSVAAPDQNDAVVVDEQTDQIIRSALKYLVSKQNPATGAWTDQGEAQQQPVAITGYAMMAFLAAGNLPGEGEYGKAVAKGAQYLLAQAGKDGYIHTQGSNMYGHGIATIVLAEIYGQTHDARIRPVVEAAAKLIVQCQNQQGGWRYAPRQADSDISVSVLQIVALRAAKNAGIDVPQPTIDRAISFIRTCYDRRSGGFTYQPHNNAPGFARTAAGVYCLQVCGQYNDPMVLTGSQFLVKAKNDGEWRTYGMFYAAPAQYMIGGTTWRNWYADQKELLLRTVRPDGDRVYWEPIDHKVGPVYATSVYAMILAMPYHYIPLYQR